MCRDKHKGRELSEAHGYFDTVAVSVSRGLIYHWMHLDLGFPYADLLILITCTYISPGTQHVSSLRTVII